MQNDDEIEHIRKLTKQLEQLRQNATYQLVLSIQRKARLYEVY